MSLCSVIVILVTPQITICFDLKPSLREFKPVTCIHISPLPIMHAIFNIPELWTHILTPEVDKFTLSIAARTCSALREPALHALWRDLGSINPLLLPLGDFEDGKEFIEDHIEGSRSIQVVSVKKTPFFFFANLSLLSPSGNFWILLSLQQNGHLFFDMVGGSRRFNFSPTQRERQIDCNLSRSQCLPPLQSACLPPYDMSHSFHT